MERYRGRRIDWARGDFCDIARREEGISLKFIRTWSFTT